MPKRPVKVKMVLQHAFERLDRLILTAAKAALLFAAVATLLPIVFRAGLRRFSQRRAAR
jgi:hypothetical protein